MLLHVRQRVLATLVGSANGRDRDFLHAVRRGVSGPRFHAVQHLGLAHGIVRLLQHLLRPWRPADLLDGERQFLPRRASGRERCEDNGKEGRESHALMMSVADSLPVPWRFPASSLGAPRKTLKVK